MKRSKESELIQAMLVYFHRCQEEGDLAALEEMGLGASEIQALTALSSDDRLRLASTKSHFLSIRLDQKVYWRMIDYILRERDRDSVIDELMLCDAPFPLIRSFTGMGGKQYQLKRVQLGIESNPAGRPAQPSAKITKTVWQEVQKLLQNSNSLSLADFLTIFKTLNKEISLQVIWFLVQQWEEDGSLHGTGTS